MRANDVSEATRHWEQVRALVGQLPETSATLRLTVTACEKLVIWRSGLPDAHVQEIYEEGKTRVARLGDPAAEARLEGSYATRLVIRGDVSGSEGRMAEFVRLATASGDEELRWVALALQAYPWSVQGRLDACREQLRAVIEATRDRLDFGMEFHGASIHLWALISLAIVEFPSGRIGEAVRLTDRVLQLARERGDLENEWIALNNCGVNMALLAGQVEESLGRTSRAREIAERTGNLYARIVTAGFLALCLTRAGRHAEAIPLLESCLGLAEQRRTALEISGRFLAGLAEAYRAAGEGERARAVGERAVAVAAGQGCKLYECQAQLTLVDVALEQGSVAAAAEIDSRLERLDALIVATGAAAFKPQVRERRARLARLRGSDGVYERELSEAQHLFTEMGATGHAERIAKELS